MLGQADDSGHYSCYSQVTTKPNNLGLHLTPKDIINQIDLIKCRSRVGYWPFTKLDERLQEKHSRAVFVKASVKNSDAGQRFRYDELVYCERPAITRFVDLVKNRRLVFEFTMSQRADGSVRNHGYPWRLLGAAHLSELFSLQVKLR